MEGSRQTDRQRGIYIDRCHVYIQAYMHTCPHNFFSNGPVNTRNRPMVSTYHQASHWMQTSH